MALATGRRLGEDETDGTGHDRTRDGTGRLLYWPGWCQSLCAPDQAWLGSVSGQISVGCSGC